MSSNGQVTPPGGKSKRQLRQERNIAANNQEGVLSKKVLMMIAVGMGSTIGFCMWLYFLTNRMIMRSRIHFLDPMEEADKVKKATLSGHPAVVFCMSETTKDNMVPPIVQEISKEVRATTEEEVEFIATDCFSKLPYLGDKTIAERFEFGKNEGFLGIFANGDKPRQLNYLWNAKDVAEQIEPIFASGIKDIIYLRDYEDCQKREACAVITAPDEGSRRIVQTTMEAMHKEFRALKFVSVFTGFWNLKTSGEFEEKKPEFESKMGNVACFLRGERELTAEEIKKAEDNGAFIENIPKTKVTYKARWGPDFSDTEGMKTFLEECHEKKSDGEEWFQLPGKHAVAARPSEPKVVSRPERPKGEGEEEDEESDDLGAGKEKIGQRPDEEKVEDDLDDEPLPEEDDAAEEVDL